MESRDDEGKDDGSGMVNSSSVGGSGTSLSNRKRASEKRRREEVHSAFYVEISIIYLLLTFFCGFERSDFVILWIRF